MKRLLLFFGFVFLQIALSLSLGYFTLGNRQPENAAPRGAVYQGVDYSGAGLIEARDAIASAQRQKAAEARGFFSYQGTEFTFQNSEIGLAPDEDRILAALDGKSAAYYPSRLFSGFLRGYGGELAPAMKADAEAFRGKLLMMKQFIDRGPKDANIELRRGAADSSYSLFLRPSEEGLSFDVDGQFDRIFEDYLAHPFEPYLLDGADGADAGTGGVVPIAPRVTSEMLLDIRTVLGEAVTPLPEGFDAELAARAASAVHKVWIPKNGSAAGPFSLTRYLKEAGLQTERRAEEYDLLATTLFLAVLRAGVDASKIEREAALNADGLDFVYCDVGFGTALLGQGPSETADGGESADDGSSGGGSGAAGDFRFTNTLDSNLVIFASAEGGALTVTVAGSLPARGKQPPLSVYSTVEGDRVRLYQGGVRFEELRTR
ncbi:MAG: hypothetical protein LBU58_00440 [Clostridiales bacterium]|jgi:hypothetical protein|nr:hypothetical protein [Clostridiales bacterium]